MQRSVKVTVDIDAGRINKLIESRLLTWAEESGALVESRARSLASIPGPPASTPGEPPRRISGDLMASIGHKVLRRGLTVVAVVFAGTPYARRLELGFFGVDGLGRRYFQASRPYLRPALLGSRREIMDALRG